MLLPGLSAGSGLSFLQIDYAEDLVGLNADDIFHKLAATGPQIPRREIQQWLIQALGLVKAQEGAAAEAVAPLAKSMLALEAAAPVSPTQSASPATGTFAITRVGNQLQIRPWGEALSPAVLTTADPRTL